MFYSEYVKMNGIKWLRILCCEFNSLINFGVIAWISFERILKVKDTRSVFNIELGISTLNIQLQLIWMRGRITSCILYWLNMIWELFDSITKQNSDVRILWINSIYLESSFTSFSLEDEFYWSFKLNSTSLLWNIDEQILRYFSLIERFFSKQHKQIADFNLILSFIYFIPSIYSIFNSSSTVYFNNCNKSSWYKMKKWLMS